MPSGYDVTTTRPSAVDTIVNAAEVLGFAHDLGGSLTHVLVAAVGRALAASPDVRSALVDDAGASGVGIACLVDGRLTVRVVHGAERDPLPDVRARVDDVLLAMRAGRLSTEDDPPAAVTIVEHWTAPTSPDVRLVGGRCVLEAGPIGGDPAMLELRLHADSRTLGSTQAEGVLAEVAALLERPYRRLV